jgi:hypothetical protein
MSDNLRTPCNLDGMGAFLGKDGAIRLIRKHEVCNLPGKRGNAANGSPGTCYDTLGEAGTATIDFDPIGQHVARDFVSLNGTLTSCAGGLAFEDIGWLNCKERIEDRAKAGNSDAAMPS